METISRNGWHDAPNLQEEKRKKMVLKIGCVQKGIYLYQFFIQIYIKYVLSFLVNYLLKLKLRSI